MKSGKVHERGKNARMWEEIGSHGMVWDGLMGQVEVKSDDVHERRDDEELENMEREILLHVHEGIYEMVWKEVKSGGVLK